MKRLDHSGVEYLLRVASDIGFEVRSLMTQETDGHAEFTACFRQVREPLPPEPEQVPEAPAEPIFAPKQKDMGTLDDDEPSL